MALRDLPLRAASIILRDSRPVIQALQQPAVVRCASTGAIGDVESNSSFSAPPPSADTVKRFNAVDRTVSKKSKKRALPSSRYQFRPPKYYRGPLHPHQPPPASDPASREFQPGPFSLPRLEQTYQTTIASDLMTLTYQHYAPGYRAPVKSQRLREWTGDSPYYKNRPLRAPRGSGEELRLLTAPRTFRNVPKITNVVLHTMVPDAQDNSAHLHVAGMVLQAISNVRATAHKSKTSVTNWGLRQDKYVSLTTLLEREDALHFLSKLVDVVLPKIKEWKGVATSTGDGSGNLSFGITADHMAFFPEVEVNYDSYPPKMIPGCHITVQTSADNDRDALLLLQAIGIPFYGRFN